MVKLKGETGNASRKGSGELKRTIERTTLKSLLGRGRTTLEKLTTVSLLGRGAGN